MSKIHRVLLLSYIYPTHKPSCAQTFLMSSNKLIAEAVYDAMLACVEEQTGKGETSTSQLKELGKSIIGSQFHGVFPIDKIPAKFKYIIANLDTSDQPGSHWIAMVGRKNREPLTYDSFGRDASEILPSDMHNVTMTEDDAEQEVKETNCGARCLAWLLLAKEFGIGAAKEI